MKTPINPTHLPPSYKPNKPHLRIADILLTDQEPYSAAVTMGGCRRVDCSSPGRVVGRWFKRFKEKRDSLMVREKIGKDKPVDLRDGLVPERCSMNRSLSVVFEESSEKSGLPGKEASLNLGIACGLVYLISSSKNELDKMMKLRTQMENLLQNVKEELQRKDTLSKISNSNASWRNEILESENSNNHLLSQSHPKSYALPESETIVVCDKSLAFDTPEQEEYIEGMDRLEAELETELERLQLDIDRDNFPKYPQQQRTKLAIKDTIPPVISDSASSGEVIDPQEAGFIFYCGVPPYELERRLHSLLEARQQEQIKELEAALEFTRHKLYEKELELSWRKETENLISQIISQSSRLASRNDSANTFEQRETR